MKTHTITFPEFSGIRCLMLPYIQGEPETVPPEYLGQYADILAATVIRRGKVGFLTIDESVAVAGAPHRGRSKWGRALHTEAGIHPGGVYGWGGGSRTWGGSPSVTLEPDVRIVLANSLDDSCALWDAEHFDTSLDGDIGNFSKQYPYSDAVLMKSGEVHEIGILTPHESLPVQQTTNRQFLRIVGAGVNGREPYFTQNRLMAA